MGKITLQKYVLIASDILSIFISYILATNVINLFNNTAYHHINLSNITYIKLANIVAIIILFLTNQLYFKRRPNWEEIRIIWKIIFLVALVNLPILLLLNYQAQNYKVVFCFWVLLLVVIPTLRSLSKLIMHNLGIWQRKLYIIGIDEEAIIGYNLFADSVLLGYKVCAFVDLKHVKTVMPINDSIVKVINLNELMKKDPDSEVIFCLDAHKLSSHTKLINILQKKFLSVMILPHLSGLPLYGTEVNHFFGNEQLLLRLDNKLSNRSNRVIKFVSNYIFALVTLPILLPIMFIISLLIYLSDRRNPFFLQKRIGKNGMVFKCIKFRTMCHNAEEIMQQWEKNQDPIYLDYVANNYKLVDDPRVIPVGRFLRKTSLDELPQIINVLLGQMSIVGPRPLIPSEVDSYPDELFYYGQVRPGITGLWQISGRSQTSFEERCRLDSWYIRNWSLWYDVVIVIKTISVVLLKDGAY
ncbi:MAG: undecaprenyl-phosphate galactose phosphotransferase WbaP [Burkholderiales bacterium]|nr:undecaprenyl-phosphate galactose phosphotransferase WbaP [Burkholderiales bacterium]